MNMNQLFNDFTSYVDSMDEYDIDASILDAAEYTVNSCVLDNSICVGTADAAFYPCCPHCGKSYYAEQYSTRTCVGWAPIYKNGMLMNHDPNVTTTYCHCLNCGKDFSFEH